MGGGLAGVLEWSWEILTKANELSSTRSWNSIAYLKFSQIDPKSGSSADIHSPKIYLHQPIQGFRTTNLGLGGTGWIAFNGAKVEATLTRRAVQRLVFRNGQTLIYVIWSWEEK